LVVTTLIRSSRTQVKKRNQEIFYRFWRASYLGGMFSLAFLLVLVPWTIRNHRVFHLFQPLAPAHAEMPGEFVPRGYLAWVRTWLDDGRYIGPVLWSLDETPIKLQTIPNRAFDSAEEKQRVAALLEKYNHPPDEQDTLFTQPDSQEAPNPSEDQVNQNKESESAKPEDESGQSDKGNTSDEADRTDEADKGDESDAADQDDEATQNDEHAAPDSGTSQPVEMTPEIDAGFAQIAQERIARHPVRYFLWVPVKRAYSLWFDTHSQYYPFEGELLPLADLDYEIHQQFWLPLFAALTFAYTLLGILGGWSLWDTRDFMARQWLLLAALIIFLRIGFFSTLENPEPRYVVEIFPFLSILGGIALSRTALLFKIGKTG
jgi:hypothetical protein